MKTKILSILIIMFMFLELSAQTKTVEVSFSYLKQRGFSSNQFAVWVEDTNGVLVKTLYATAFTAKGGWKKREASLPEWVKKAGLASKPEIDGVTGATPSAGSLTYEWDFSGGKAGDYFICIEATLRSEKRVIYRAKINTAKAASVRPEPVYFGDDSKERSMISNVVITVK